MIPSQKYTPVKKLGEGGQGSIFLVKDETVQNETASLVVLKKIKCDDLTELNFALQEAQAVLRLKHPFVVHCKEFYIERSESSAAQNGLTVRNERVCIIYEYCERGSLQQFINRARQRGAVISPKYIVKWMKQIAIAVQFIHEMNVIHRDMKPDNIFLTNSTYDVKLGDFGFAKSLESEGMTNTVLGTKFYAAPEIRKRIPYNNKLDIWGIGCILLELLLPQSVDYAYEMVSNAEEVYKAIRERYSEAMVSFVQKVVVLDMNSRPKASEILSLINEYQSQLLVSNSATVDVATILAEDEQDVTAEVSASLIQLQVEAEEMISSAINEEEIKAMKQEIKRLRFKLDEVQQLYEDSQERLFFSQLATRQQLSFQYSETTPVSPTTPRGSTITFPSSSSSNSSTCLSFQPPNKEHLFFKLPFLPFNQETPAYLKSTPINIPAKEIRPDPKKDKIKGGLFITEFGFWKYNKQKEEIPVVLKFPSNLYKGVEEFKIMCKYDRLVQFKNPYIERILGITEMNKQFCMVAESGSLGVLRNTLLNHNVTLSLKNKLAIAYGVASAVMYIHESGYVACLVKSNTFALADLNTPKYFCASVAARQSQSVHMSPGLTSEYQSPQCKQMLPFTPADDVYSMSIIMYEIMFRKLSFPPNTKVPETARPTIHLQELFPELPATTTGSTSQSASASATTASIERTSNGSSSSFKTGKQNKLSLDQRVVEEYVELMQQCWHADATARPTARTVVYKLALLLEMVCL